MTMYMWFYRIIMKVCEIVIFILETLLAKVLQGNRTIYKNIDIDVNEEILL